MDRRAEPHAARNATTSTGTASPKLNRDPLGSQFLNDSADAFDAGVKRSEALGHSASFGSTLEHFGSPDTGL